jgi:hypothetical protein
VQFRPPLKKGNAMIEESREGYDIDCDHCYKGIFIKAKNWRGMLTELTKRQWTFKKREKGDYLHLCPACTAKKRIAESKKVMATERIK